MPEPDPVRAAMFACVLLLGGCGASETAVRATPSEAPPPVTFRGPVDVDGEFMLYSVEVGGRRFVVVTSRKNDVDIAPVGVPDGD